MSESSNQFQELVSQIRRFQELADETGREKSSSYCVSIYFDGAGENVYIELGTYDVADLPRTSRINTDVENMLQDLTKFVDTCFNAVHYNHEIM